MNELFARDVCYRQTTQLMLNAHQAIEVEKPYHAIARLKFIQRKKIKEKKLRHSKSVKSIHRRISVKFFFTMFTQKFRMKNDFYNFFSLSNLLAAFMNIVWGKFKGKEIMRETFGMFLIFSRRFWWKFSFKVKHLKSFKFFLRIKMDGIKWFVRFQENLMKQKVGKFYKMFTQWHFVEEKHFVHRKVDKQNSLEFLI